MAANTEALREKYSETSTETLLGQWAEDSRMEWAEEILEKELLSRGVDSDRLASIKASRASYYESKKHTDAHAVDDLTQARLGAFLIGAFLFVVFRALGLPKLGGAAFLLCIAAYLVVLVRTIFRPHGTSSGGVASYRITMFALEGMMIVFMILIVLWNFVF